MAEANAESAVNGDSHVDAVHLRRILLASSTKNRIQTIQTIRNELSSEDISVSQITPILNLLFDTYPLYVDSKSRQAVEQCLSDITQRPNVRYELSGFVKDIETESVKTSIAPANAFVLVRWCSLLLQHLATEKDLWDAWGIILVHSITNALHAFLGSEPRGSTLATALRVSRRGFRTLFKSEHGEYFSKSCIVTLTAKASVPAARNAITLGIIGGVCRRLPSRQLLETQTSDYNAFYLREIIGSRAILPAFIAHALDEYFNEFVSLEDLRKDIVPAIEKALLRAPEIVLDDLVAPMVAALSPEIDLSDILASSLLRPLMSSIKSSNAAVRTGAVYTFEVIASRCKNEQTVSKIADELLTPLKQGKVTAADQRVLHAQMLAALKPSEILACSIQNTLAPVASKEANDTAAAAEVAAIGIFVLFALNKGKTLDAAISDAFMRGLSDKRLPIRKIWALELGNILWSLDDTALQGDGAMTLVDTCLSKLVDTWNEVQANPLTAVQNGQVTVANVATALVLEKAGRLRKLKNAPTLNKAAFGRRVLVLEPKPSYLLSARIYTKLTSEEDVTWNVRALASTLHSLPPESTDPVCVAWAQSMIFILAAAGIPHKARTDAIDSLRRLYASNPRKLAAIITAGLWRWCEDVETNNKDSAAVTSRTGRLELHQVVRAICVPPAELQKLGGVTDQGVIDEQLIQLLVLCRQDLLPRAAWIDMCIRTGTDPGTLASSAPQECLRQVVAVTENPALLGLPAFQSAAFNTAAELAFVAPEVMTTIIVEQIKSDLDPSQLVSVGPTEAAIFRTSEGTAFVDVLAKQSQSQSISKNTRDYDTLKWEEELRAQIAQKKGQTKRLTPDEQAKVTAQLTKESQIRLEVTRASSRLRRGVGMVTGLATGPPAEAEAWFGPSVKLLFDAIEAGAGLILGDAAALGYLQCSGRISSRLGTMRPFVGVATLRAAGITILPEDLLAENLGDLVTRVLYRLRFMSEQRPFDTVTLSYILPLVFLVLQKGGIDRAPGEEADEQIVLAVEFLACHTETCSDTQLPREQLLGILITSMEQYTQHFRDIRDCFTDLCRSIAPTATHTETAMVVKGCIVPEVSVRGAVLQAISAELNLERAFYPEIWLACHDDVDEHVDIAHEIWEENDLKVTAGSALLALPYLESKDAQLRRSAARSVATSVKEHASIFHEILTQLQETYIERAKPRMPQRDQYGMPLKIDLTDPWESRHGISLAFKELAKTFPESELVPFTDFLIHDGPLGDKSNHVRDGMVDAATAIVALRGKNQVEPLMKQFESALDGPESGLATQDLVNEAVVILYGALARHLAPGDERVPKVVDRLLDTLSTPSESVQYAVAQCLPPLVQASSQQCSQYVSRTIDQTLQGKKYAARRGAAYGLAGIVNGRGIGALREFRVMSTLRSAAENKKDQSQRQGAFLAYELLSLILGRVFEPYVIRIVPQLLVGFGDTTADVRDACLDAAKTCFASLSSYGVKQVLPTLLEGLDEQQWRSKKGACDSLGAMAYLDPQQLAVSLPDIIPPLTDVLNDSHKEVRASANRSLQRFGEVISNPEVKSQVNILLKALSDPTKYTDDALDALIKVNFIHYLDAPSLALVVRILERGLGDRSATKRKAAQIIGSLAHLTERKDLIAHLPILVAGLRAAIVDPVPTTRATASKALGSTIEKLGEDALPDLIPSLMQTLKSDTGAGDRLGSAQALSEVLAGLGTGRLEETLPTILQNVSSNKASVREGFMSLFIFLPACFGNSFANYLSRIIPSILAGLADDIESIRDTALRAGRLLVKNFATRSIDLLLPELERGLADDSYRIRLSSVELVGDLLFSLTGISGKTEQDEVDDGAYEAGQSLLEVLGEEKRNKVLSALYICRNDTSGLVRTAAVAVWKALVATPRTLRELIPTLTQLIIRRLASSNMEQKVIAGNTLGELIRKAGDGVLASLLPTLGEGLQNSTDTDARQGICIALRELIASASPESLEDYEKTLISVVRTALVDQDADVREAAAEAFDSLQKILGKRAVDQVLPHLLSLLRSEDEAENALSALLTLLTEQSRSNIILPNLLPTLLTSPISAFNARALAALAEVASSAMTRRLPNILNALMDNIVTCKDEDLKAELNTSFDTVLLSVDEYDGLNTAMSVMFGLVKHDDHRKRASADTHLAKFFESGEVEFARYYPDLIRALLNAFEDSDAQVVKAAWTALNALTQRLRKEEMESLVVSTRQTLNHVGVAGHDLPGFSLPKGINAVLPIFLQGLMNGSAEQRTQAALAISDLIDRTSPEGLKPFVTQITGPLIRVVSERSVDLKAAILLTLNNLLEKIPTFLKPFLPQLQRTFAKSLADPSSEVLRTRAAKALGTLITMTPRIDPLIAELVTGSKTSDAGVRHAMLKALYEVVSKAGTNMNEVSRNSILGLIDFDTGDADDAMNITNARLLGALIKVLPLEVAVGLVKSRVLTNRFTHNSVLALNSVLLESPESLTAGTLGDITPNVIVQGISNSHPFIADNAILAAGKWLLTDSSRKSYEATKPLFEALASAIAPGKPVDTRRLSLVVTRTVSRADNDLVRPHLAALVPAVFASVRDMVIPVKLSAEAAFLSLFQVVEEESEVFDKYMAGPGASLQPGPRRAMQDYFKRIVLRLGAQARERKEAEAGQGGLGLSGDEREDEREVWSVGKVDLGEGAFAE